MTDHRELAQAFLDSLKSGTPRPDLLSDGVIFMALNTNVGGRDAVLARLAAATTGKIYREVNWQILDETEATFTVKGLLPVGSRMGGVILVLHFDGAQISVIQQQNIPGTPMPASEVKLSAALKGLIDNALASRNPMLVAYVDQDGQPVVSFRGSTQALSDDQLAIWIRNAEGSFIRSVRSNPKVALMYRDEDTKATYQFQGRARVADDDATRRKVYDGAPEVEQHHDFARTGVALVIDLDYVQGYAGLGPTGQIDPVRMARGADK